MKRAKKRTKKRADIYLSAMSFCFDMYKQIKGHHKIKRILAIENRKSTKYPYVES